MVCVLRSTLRRVAAVLCLTFLAGFCGFAQTSAPAQILLPKSFAGWTQQSAAKAGTSPADLDSANADVLNEYGLKNFEEGAYHHAGGKMEIRAMQFGDATGAYGAFTFYRKPSMRPMAIGRGAAGDVHEIVFWTGTTVVDATFSSEPSGAASSLRSLARAIPSAGGSSGVPPTLPDYLPVKSLDRMSLRYAIGPAGYAKGGGVLPPDSIAFNRDAEAVTARYSTGSGQGTLTLLEFPTPQMAIQAERSLSALIKGPLPASLQSSPAALGVRRDGPLVAITNGNFSSDEAHELLAQVKYQANVTWNQPRGSNSEIKKAASMLIGIAYLTAILAACAILLGLFLGGGRAAWRVMRGKPASTVHEQDFISLNLSDWQHPKVP